MSSEEFPEAPEPKLTPEQMEESQKIKEKLQKTKEALGITRMNEDMSELRAEIHSVATNLNKLCDALGSANNANQQQAQSQQQTQSDEIPPEQKMLLLKDGIAGVADLVKAWKGTTASPQMQQQNDFQSMIMQSFAKMIQAKVDETIFSTYGTQIPVDQLQQVRNIQNQAANIAQATPAFEK
ncbi:MAG: hypothetical protein COA77_02530 [Thaumarchaeota archaeon]|nr:MAG: hypothetical protein COA77_02530 [Nitrososphaerota archaeon]